MESERRQSELFVSVLPALALVLLAASGIVFATSWFIDYSTPVLVLSGGVAFVAAIAVAVTGWRGARRTGVGCLASLAASVKRLGRFGRDFF